jgi:hypothetical protein
LGGGGGVTCVRCAFGFSFATCVCLNPAAWFALVGFFYCLGFAMRAGPGRRPCIARRPFPLGFVGVRAPPPPPPLSLFFLAGVRWLFKFGLLDQKLQVAVYTGIHVAHGRGGELSGWGGRAGERGSSPERWPFPQAAARRPKATRVQESTHSKPTPPHLAASSGRHAQHSRLLLAVGRWLRTPPRSQLEPGSERSTVAVRSPHPRPPAPLLLSYKARLGH